MITSETAYARTQADGLDNIAPTALQGQQAWQFAQSDNFLSQEEASAVMRKQLEPYQSQINERLAQVGYPAEHLASRPDVQAALYSGQPTPLMTVAIAPDMQITGRLRVVMTEEGPDIRITPAERALRIPDEVEGVRLSKGDKQQLTNDGALSRPILTADNGEYFPTFLRVDKDTNTLELWRVRPELLPTKLMGIDLTKDQQLQLANGHAVRLTGLLDKQGEPFNATVNISPANKGLEFSDFSRVGVSLKPDNENRNQLALNNEGAKSDLTRNREVTAGGTITSNKQDEALKQSDTPDLSEKAQSQRVRR